jgi:hypothetical protein
MRTNAMSDTLFSSTPRNIQCVALLAFALAAPLPAQWIKFPTAGIPRTADGKPDLSAPAPRTPDGKPDLSGLWHQANGVKYTVNLAADLKPEDVPYQPWAEALYKQRQDSISKDDPVGYCNFPGVPQMEAVPYPYKFMNAPGMIVILYEAFHIHRQIFMDGRGLPKDPNPTWMGYSVGRWDGDTLVVDSSGFNDKTWLDTFLGRPASEMLHVQERFRRTSFGDMEVRATIDDPKAFTKPWTTTAQKMHLQLNTEILEFSCNENEKDIQHQVVKQVVK